MKRTSGILVSLLAGVLLTSCATAPGRVRPPLEDEGQVFLYLRPFPREADRLSFTLSGLAAVRDDGQEVPISLRTTEFRPTGSGRQQLLGEGILPQGAYAATPGTGLGGTEKIKTGLNL